MKRNVTFEEGILRTVIVSCKTKISCCSRLNVKNGWSGIQIKCYTPQKSVTRVDTGMILYFSVMAMDTVLSRYQSSKMESQNEEQA